MNMKFEEFLNEVSGLYSKHKEKNKENNKQGKDYNVFTILGLKTEEVRLHSAFLANLLNPKGSHGLGDKLLKAFVKILKKKNNSIPDNLDTSSAFVSVEYDIGIIDEKQATGGRLDIRIDFNSDYAIIIENKINAGDQSQQLLRYKNYADSFFQSRYCICYLTLEGKEPSEYSTGFNSEKYWTSLSYSQDILSWLKVCQEIADNDKNSPVKEVVVQYENLLRQICENTEGENKMDKELVDYLVKDDNLIMADEFNTALIEAKKRIWNDCLIKKLKEKYTLSEYSSFDGINPFTIIIRLDTIFSLTFKFDKKMWYGIPEVWSSDESAPQIQNELKNKYKNSCYRQSYQQIMWDYIDEVEWNTKLIVELKNDSRLLKLIEEKADQIISDFNLVKNNVETEILRRKSIDMKS